MAILRDNNNNNGVCIFFIFLVLGVELMSHVWVVQADSPCTRACPNQCLVQRSQNPGACYLLCVHQCSKGGRHKEEEATLVSGQTEETVGNSVQSQTNNEVDIFKLLLNSTETVAAKAPATAVETTA
ncbi:hypothetical protein DM860_001324 [Cuscuta australis]|uniref:Uncharacterized protein n=1 Tax=Cuscuta australis TaxID=267555 RepID=A0A328DTK3_9ASTE|nr:hypothetical protein DM860_001324 [Cuscuta australis]